MKQIQHSLTKNAAKLLALPVTLALASCSGWINEPQPGVTELEDFFTSGEAAVQVVNAAYVPLAWEFGETYCNEWFIGDIVSDDALKGGQNANDMADAYDMENWKTIPNNGLLLDFYRAQYQGVGRANLAIEQITPMELDSTLTQRTKTRLLAEAHFLRAYYYFRLVRVFGGVPKVDFVVDSDSKWQQERASARDIYDFILSDLVTAQAGLWRKSEYPATELGRATKGAAQAMLMKVNLYMAGAGNLAGTAANATEYYRAAKAWGDSVITSQEYSLCPDYADNFTLEGENGQESVFEIQYAYEATSSYAPDGGSNFGYTNGTFSVIQTRSRSSKLGGGWGFNKPTQNLYDEYEPGDTRRDVTILNPPDSMITNPAEEIYLGSRYLNRKYAMYNDDLTFYEVDHVTRYPINNKQIRYADVLLMYAEACLGLGDEGTATTYLNQVRQRPSVNLPAYPGYAITINGKTVDAPTLEQAIRHERRMELAMEGHRWFDLCRWGVAKETMDAYKATETAEAQSQMAEFIKGKHELFPIPMEEIDLNPVMDQNPGYN